MAIPNKQPTTIGACAEGTAGSGTGTTAVALPAGAQVLVANTGSVLAYLKLGASSGPDATDTTTGGGRVPLPAGSVQVFTKRSTDTHAYLYAASNTTYSLVGADGE